MFRTVPILLFILTLWPLLASAQGNPAYTVNDVKVDIVAESSVKARNQAFSAAQTKAFKMLAERFVGPDRLTGFVMPDAATISGMVADFEITSEQLSKRRYLGTYIFRFKAGPVNRYFGNGPISGDYTAIQSAGKILLLPLFSQNAQTSLWDTKKNPWLQAWQNQNDKDTALLIPTGDVSDTMDIRETVAENITQSGLKRMRARYNVNEIVILSAVFDQYAKDILKINTYRTDRGKIELVQTIAIAPGKATRLGQLLASAVPQMKTLLSTNWKGQALVPMSAGEQNADVRADDISDTGYDPVDDKVRPSIREQIAAASPALVAAPQSGQVHVVARFASMNEWLAIRRSLNGIPSLQSIRILGLTTNQVSMEFIYSDWAGLTSALSSRGLTLQSTGPGQYNLSKTAGYLR